MKKVVLCFGSEFLKEDRLCFDICDELKDGARGFRFVKCMLPNEILEYLNHDKVIILDVVKGIDDVVVIKDFKMLKERKIATVHDFDLGFFLEVLGRMRDMGNVIIIGVPMGFDKEVAKEKVKGILDKLDL